MNVINRIFGKPNVTRDDAEVIVRKILVEIDLYWENESFITFSEWGEWNVTNSHYGYFDEDLFSIHVNKRDGQIKIIKLPHFITKPTDGDADRLNRIQKVFLKWGLDEKNYSRDIKQMLKNNNLD